MSKPEKAVPHHFVAVAAFASEETGETIMVTCCVGPDQGYAARDQVHAGFVVHDKFVQDEKGPKLTAVEITKVLRSYGALRVALNTIHDL